MGPLLAPLALAAAIGAAALVFTMLFAPAMYRPDAQPVAYGALKEQLRDGAIARVELTGLDLIATGCTPAGGEPARYLTQVPALGDPGLLPLIEESGAELVVSKPPQQTAFGWLLPLLLIAGVYLWTARRMAGGGLTGIVGKSWKLRKERAEVRFDQVAGQDAAKREIAELVEFLRDPERFARVGAKVPRGVLLMGPPGTGKTLLARALAGEAGVPFFSTTGSSFIEVYVGVGASRVRKLFEEARANAPAIVFIDELDSIGRVRGAGLGGGHDEREQTLNQILAELDGFDERVAVVVLAATNRPDVLDPALLRPGRFDRHVTLELPDRAGRRAILDVHAKGVPLASDSDLDLVAAGTPGFSGADLKNLLNEAAIDAAREGAREVRAAHLDSARDRVMMGTVRTLAIRPEEKHRIAVHEAGHATVAFHMPNADPLLKVTIIPRGRSLGGTYMIPTEERHTLPEAFLSGQLSVMLAGRAAERIFLGSVSSGANDDIARATRLARSMVARWGMAEEIGPMDLRQSEDHPFLGREIAQPRAFSDIMAAKVDEEVAKRLRDAEQVALDLIEAHRTAVERLIDALERHETLDAAAVTAALSSTAAAMRHGRS